MKRSRRAHTWALSRRLYRHYHSFDNLPFLPQPTAQMVWLSFVTVVVLGSLVSFHLARPEKLIEIDPLIHPVWYWNLIPMLLLLALALFFAQKEWAYYYGNGHRKDGLFFEKLRWANELERSLDYLLVVLSGLVTGFALLPTLWPLCLSAYSAVAVARCYVTVRRPAYASWDQSECGSLPPECCWATLEEDHRVEEYSHRM